MSAANSGSATVVDAYFGILLLPGAGPIIGCPADNAVALFTDSFTGVVFTCLSAPSAFRALRPNMSIPSAMMATTDSNFFGFLWPCDIPAGTYTIFMALLRPGALASDSLDAGAFIAVAAISMTFGP